MEEKKPQVLNQLGPYVGHKPVAAFCSISEHCLALFHEALDGYDRGYETPVEHLFTRLTYISETTSTAIRLNATWALTLPAMSLLRDRYEQTVRTSWLAQQPDNLELVKYIGTYYAKANKVFRGLSPKARNVLEDASLKFDPWMTDTPTKEERAYLERWNSLDLHSIAKKRDALAACSKDAVRGETLADLYIPIYQQFSSVTHFDMYGVNMLGLHKAPTGEVVLAPDPWWPAILCCYNALFDLIQFNEVAQLVYKVGSIPDFDELFAEWRKLSDQIEFGSPKERSA